MRTVDLFTDDGEVRFFGGVFKGKEGIRRLYVERFQKHFTHGVTDRSTASCSIIRSCRMIIHVQPDGRYRNLRGRIDDAGRASQGSRRKRRRPPVAPMVGRRHLREHLPKVDGIWRIHILNYMPQWHADFETGWAHTRPNYVPFLDATYPTDPTGPDALIEDSGCGRPTSWVPFTDPHPVTGKPIVSSGGRATSTAIWRGRSDKAAEASA